MSIPASVSVSNEREIQPMNLSLEQLNALKTQHEDEIQELQKQLEVLVNARSRFFTAKNSLKDLGTYNEGDKILVPLNSSLYIPGTIMNADKVIVELGTGYYAEKSVPAANDLIDRKTGLVGKSIETVESVSFLLLFLFIYLF